MKRIFSAVLLLILCLSLAAPALADVAYAPQDSFWEHHSRDCVYEDRCYYTNGEDGYVLVYGSPAGKAEDVLPNGLRLYISYSYNGEWGCVEYDRDDPVGGSWKNYASGWIKMSGLTADYDYRAFAAEHSGEYTEINVILPMENEPVYTYKYPGSGEVYEELDPQWARDDLYFSSVFTDPAGRDWGFVGYYYGHRNFWVCLDDPHNDTLEPDENFRVVETVPAADADAMAAALKTAKAPTLYLYAGAFGVAVIAAAVLAAVLRKRKKA